MNPFGWRPAKRPQGPHYRVYVALLTPTCSRGEHGLCNALDTFGNTLGWHGQAVTLGRVRRVRSGPTVKRYRLAVPPEDVSTAGPSGAEPPLARAPLSGARSNASAISSYERRRAA